MPNMTPFVFKRVLSFMVMEESITINSSTIKRHPIVDILSFTSLVEILFDRLSNIYLLGDCY
jgi:hypothetical protein